MKANDEPPVEAASDAQAMHASDNSFSSERFDQSPESLESSHIERVSSFVRQHRHSMSQGKQVWISTNSILSFKDRKNRAASFTSTNSVGPVNDERFLIAGTPDKPVCGSPEAMLLGSIQTEASAPKYPAETYGKLLYQGEAGVEQSEIVPLLGKDDPYHAAVLRSYMAEFNFSEMDIDDAFRRVCEKIDILGETQVIDRILFQISQRYWDCNEKMRNVFLTVDMTYGILFSLVLLNTDLNIANIGAKESRKMTKKDFLKNTMDLACSMIESNQDLQDWLKSDKKREWKKDLQSLLKNYYLSIRDKGFIYTGTAGLNSETIKSPYTLGRDSSSWSISSGKSSSSFFSTTSSSSSRALSRIKGFMSRATKSESKLPVNEGNKDTIYEGLVIRKHMMENFDQKARNRRWFKCRIVLKMNENEVKLVMQPYDSRKSKSVLALPPSGPAAYQFLSFSAPEVLDLLHAVAEPLTHMSYSVKRPHVVLLALGNGSTYLFQVQSLEAKETWARKINYCAASRSKEPLRDVLSSTDYGWNRIEWAVKKALMDGQKVDFHDLPPYSPGDLKLVVNFERPIHNFRNALVSNVGVEKQCQNFENQISIVKEELSLHQTYKDGIEIMYQDSPVKELALSNWKKKKSYLDAEINKYSSYVAALKGRNAKAKSQTGGSYSLHRLLETDN